MVDTVVAKALLGRDEKIVRVDLGARSYDIKIGRGLLEGAGAEIAASFRKSRRPVPSFGCAVSGRFIVAFLLYQRDGEATPFQMQPSVRDHVEALCLDFHELAL